MPKSVVGLFDSQQDAQAAQQALGEAGIRRDTTVLVDESDEQLAPNLVQAGVDEQDAVVYSNQVQQGDTLLVAQAVPDQHAEHAADIVDQHKGNDPALRPTMAQRASMDRASMAITYATIYPGQELVIPIIEEHLAISKRKVERGGVRLHITTHEQPIEEQITVRDERVNVERRRIDQPLHDTTTAFQDNVYEMRGTGEEVVVDKQAQVVEEVHVVRDVEERIETVRDTVKRTRVEIEQIPDTFGPDEQQAPRD